MSTLHADTTQYHAITEDCGLLDRSERGKLALTGADAKSFLQGQVTNDVEALAPGQGCYAAFLTPKGKMLGDLRILDTGEELLLDTERPALQALFNLIRRAIIGHDVQLHKRTLERGLLSLIGPRAAARAGISLPEEEHSHLLAAVGGPERFDRRGHAERDENALHMAANSSPSPIMATREQRSVGEVPVRAIRTDFGIDLLCDSSETDAVRETLLGAGALPISEAVAECVRIERGQPRYGVDLDDTVIPQEAGLNERAVSFTKGCYVGQETVARLHYRGKPNRHLRGLRCEAPVAHGDQLSREGRIVGQVGSAAISPRYGPIALALVRREAPPGSAVAVGTGEVGAEVLELPFG